MFQLAVLPLLIGYLATAQSRLAIQNGHFVLNGQRVFLSGGNLPWIYYGYDFGDHQWDKVKSQIENQIQMVHNAGGNSIRLWVHIQAETTPVFDHNGYVTGPDHQGTLLNDIKNLLDTAQKYDVLVFPTLWNCAVDQDRSHRLDGLIRDHRKLQVTTVHSVDKCLDPTKLTNSGAGWAGKKYSYQDMLRLEYYSACGTLDFYQFHSYAFQGHFDEVAPFKHRASQYGLHKPIVVGEFWEKDGGGMNINQLFDYVYNHGYAGAWSWDLMNHGGNQRKGMTHIRGYTNHGKVAIDI
ncbi:mannan endo-1,4-beta-mannosidase [Aplysia californica]|uniref:Mannan endo-1,4-beta-mannosidase n=1 Tax=Aplysia californica TaxID=6500 RepID=A0ABM1VR39_APLCA|nr:mannan endo-1,4-beta-mannosidase [Aplysia californica]